MSPRASSYDAIIDAAEAVVIEAGASHMTLDAVAARAGVSKGGLLHHFPSKVALLEAMVKRRIEMHNERRQRILEGLGDDPSRQLKSLILSFLSRDCLHDNLGASLFAAVAHNPRLNEPIRKIVRQTYLELAPPGMSFEKASIFALAADALWMHEMLSISPFDEQERMSIINELMRLIEESTQ